MAIFKEITGEGEDIVLIHGGSADHCHMKIIAEQLSDRYRVTNIDLPGVGDSSWDPEIKNIEDIVEAILDSLPPKAIYMGWSFGGLVSMSILSKYPERVTCFIGLGTTPKFIETADWPGFPSPGYAAYLPDIKAAGINKFMKEGFYEGEFSKFDPKPVLFHRLCKTTLHQPEKLSLDVLDRIIHIVDATDLREQFRTFKCPIDLIFGTEDPNVPQAAIPKIKSLNPNVRTHFVAGAQHLFFWTHPEEFTSILRRVLA